MRINKNIAYLAALTGVLLGSVTGIELASKYRERNAKSTIEQKYGNLTAEQFKVRFDALPADLPTMKVEKHYLSGSQRGLLLIRKAHPNLFDEMPKAFEDDLRIILNESQQDSITGLEYLRDHGYTTQLGIEGCTEPSIAFSRTLTHKLAEYLGKKDSHLRSLYLQNLELMEQTVAANRKSLEQQALAENRITLATFVETPAWDSILSQGVKRLNLKVYAPENFIYMQAANIAVAQKDNAPTLGQREEWRRLFKLYDELREQHLFHVPGNSEPFNTYEFGLGHELTGPEIINNWVNNQALHLASTGEPVSVAYLTPKTFDRRAETWNRLLQEFQARKRGAE